MTTVMITYRFSEIVELENLNPIEIDRELYYFLNSKLSSGEIVYVCEFQEVDYQLNYIEFPDRIEAEMYIEIVMDIEKQLVENFKEKEVSINDFVREKITEYNLVYEQHMLRGNDKYIIVRVINLAESHI